MGCHQWCYNGQGEILLFNLIYQLIYPAVFTNNEEGYLVGSAARETINPNEIYLYVPAKLLITVDKALNSSEIGFIFEEHKYLFKATEDRDYLVLLVFLIYEHQKGPNSFWYPYFAAIDPGDLPCFWDQKVIDCISDAYLKKEFANIKADMLIDWDIIHKLMRVYSPDIFELGKCTFDLYKRCASFI